MSTLVVAKTIATQFSSPSRSIFGEKADRLFIGNKIKSATG
jgi:hypothetical protein